MFNKPAGVAVHGGSGMSLGLIEALRAARPETVELELVHRLDRETSGCLVVAKRRAALRDLHRQLREGETEKRYLDAAAAVTGTSAASASSCRSTPTSAAAASGTWPCAQTASVAVSTFEPVQFFGRLATLVEVELGTGRTHQIRVHAAHAGYPVAGDDKYGDRGSNEALRAYGLTRMFLHSSSTRSHAARHARAAAVSAPLADGPACRARRAARARHRQPRAAQRAARARQRQAGRRGRIAGLDPLEQRDAERFGLEAAGAVERLVALDVARDLVIARASGSCTTVWSTCCSRR